LSGTSWPLHQAKNRLSAVIAAAQAGEAQLVTRHGRPVAVVVSFEEYTRLEALSERSPPSFARQLLALPQDDGTFPPGELEPRPLDP
jgi:prevent-host-death family protein